MSNPSLLNLIKSYGGKWVAIKPETQTVVSSGKNIKIVHKEALKKGVGVPTLFKVPTKVYSVL